jgi:hypothetical protein
MLQTFVRPRWRIFLLVGLVIMLLAAGLVLTRNRPQVPPESLAGATINPTAIANLTTLPNMPALSEADTQLLDRLSERVNACGDYSDARRDQMQQHIIWLKEPHQIPPDVAVALSLTGTVNARLIYGMAIFTSTEWRLLQRPAESCLIEIGRTLNNMLVAAGEPPLTIYDETGS